MSSTVRSLLDPSRPRCERWVTMCSWCHAVLSVTGDWALLDAARLEELRTSDGRFPQVTHGICPPCARELLQQAG